MKRTDTKPANKSEADKFYRQYMAESKKRYAKERAQLEKLKSVLTGITCLGPVDFGNGEHGYHGYLGGITVNLVRDKSNPDQWRVRLHLNDNVKKAMAKVGWPVAERKKPAKRIKPFTMNREQMDECVAKMKTAGIPVNEKAVARLKVVG